MIEKLVEAVIVFLVVGGMSYVIGLGVAHFVETSIRRRFEDRGLDEKLNRYAILAQRFEQRRDAMLPRLVRLDAQVKSARRRHYMVNKRINDLKIARSQLMRVIGEEDAFLRAERPARKFITYVINRHVQRAQLDQKEHPFLSRSWARTQQVVIWAPTIGDAKVLAERSYPPATGFFISEITEPQSEADDLTPLQEAEMKAVVESRGAL
jgi:hypothetical protein